MKKNLNILLAVTSLVLLGSCIDLQAERKFTLKKATDPIAKVSIDNLSQRTISEFEFDIHVKRISSIWERWAGGTYQLKVDGLIPTQYDSTVMEFSLIPGSSQLLEQKYVKDVLTRYVIAPEIVPNSNLAVTVIGPDEFTYSKFVSLGDSIRIGRFRLRMLDSSKLKDSVYWVTPWEVYQAESFKMEVDSFYLTSKLYSSNDNVEMNDLSCFSGTTDRRRDTFMVASRASRCMIVDSLQAIYLGDRFVKIRWNTLCEQGVEGYVLRRRAKANLCVDPSDLEFKVVRRFGRPFDPEMYSKGATLTGFPYDLTAPDTIRYRDIEYEYELSGIYYDGTQKFLDTASVYIPNGVIIRSAVFPNPVTDSATIHYMVDDAVYLTAKVYDLTGKEIQTLMENKLHSRRVTMKDWREVQDADSYKIGWTRPDQGGQGMYFVVFIAYPVQESGIELSRSILKVMVVR